MRSADENWRSAARLGNKVLNQPREVLIAPWSAFAAVGLVPCRLVLLGAKPRESRTPLIRERRRLIDHAIVDEFPAYAGEFIR